MTAVVCGYALLTKVFPATLNANDTLGRLRVPFDYWNATGLMAALGLPACLWAGTRPATGRVLRSLTVPALAVLLTALVLSYSRGAVLAAVIGLGCWFVLVPLRLRGDAPARAGRGRRRGRHRVGARPPRDHPPEPVVGRADRAGPRLRPGAPRGRHPQRAAPASRSPARWTGSSLPDAVRRRIGTALLICVALVPVAAIAGAAASSRGLTGQISHVWSELTSTAPSSGVGNSPGRLAQLSNSRPLYWSEGLKVGEHSLLAGTGAGGFDTARTRYTTNPLEVAHAHSYAIETFADFGLIGIALSLALLIAWGAAVRRTLTPTTPTRLRADRPDHDARRGRHLRGLLADRLDLVHPGRHRAGARVRRLAGRPRTADRSRRGPRLRRPAGRGTAAARPGRGRGRRSVGGRPDRRLVRVAAAALVRPGHRRDRRPDPRRRAGRPGRRPERRRQRSGVGGSAVGALGDLLGAAATRPPAAPSS